MPSKYQPLTHVLAEAAERGKENPEFGFDDIAILVGGLPSSADRRQWWANTDHPQARAWHAAGYQVDQVYLERRRVRFTKSSTRPRRESHDASPPAPALSPAAVAGPPVDIRVRLQWIDAGAVILDRAGKPTFPRLNPSPGLYRLTFTGRDARIYIGESDNLHRRLSTNYRNPGPSQQTTMRINGLLREHLALGGSVLVAVATCATVVIDTVDRPLELSNKTGRLLAESAALVHARAEGVAQIVNLG